MEHLNGSWGENWGPVGTKFFMRDYANFQETFADDMDEDLAEPDEEGEVTTTTAATVEPVALGPRQNLLSDLVKIYSLSQSYIEDEMVRGGTIMIPYLVVGFVIMCVCSIISVMTRALYMHQENWYKNRSAKWLVLTSVTVVLNCFGNDVPLWCAICIHTLRHTVPRSFHRPTRGSYQQKLWNFFLQVLSEVGPAILISCLTNVFADAVGSFTSSPEITLLCTGNMLSMCVAFVYQMTFYAGLMTLVGRREIGEDIEEKNRMAISIAENRVNIAKHHRTLTRKPSKFHEATKPVISKCMKDYVEIMTTPFVYVGVFLIYVAYLALSIYGITRINISLTATKLFATDSPLLELDRYRVTYQVPVYSMATVFVKNPGNLSEPERLRRINEYVTIFDYSVKERVKHFSEDELKYFLKWPEYDFWSGFVKLRNGSQPGEEHLDRFFFTTGFHGESLSDWNERGRMLHAWRNVVDNYRLALFRWKMS
ncbi:patched family protein [Ostertagia ostertagi]